MSQVFSYLQHTPQIDPTCYLAPGSQVIGQATLGPHVSLWPGTIVRADIHAITIGRMTNLQDMTVCHVADDGPCHIGEYCTVGHRATIHGCTVGNYVLVGMGAIILNYARIGDWSIIAAGSLVTEGMVIPPYSLVIGTPAKIRRELTPDEAHKNKYWAQKYRRVVQEYQTGLPAEIDPDW
ncbi:MAG: Protein YrdA [bacterium]|nr:Protein YrdA [bacterium]